MGESDFGVTTARNALVATGTLSKDAVAIASIAREEQAQLIALGYPVQAQDLDNRMARACDLLAGHLRELGMEVHLVDEAMTSIEAENNLRETTLTAANRRKLRDGEAARLILERFFDEQKGT